MLALNLIFLTCMVQHSLQNIHSVRRDCLRLKIPNTAEEPENIGSTVADVVYSSSPKPISTTPTLDSGAEQEICPNGQSRISKNDLINLVNYAAKKQRILESILDGYYLEGLALHKNYTTKFDKFSKTIEIQAEHLNHVLDDIVTRRKDLELVLERLQPKIQQIDEKGDSYRQILKKVDEAITKFKKIKQICELKNCQYATKEPRVFLKNSVSNVNDSANVNSTCINLDVAYSLIKRELSKIKKNQTEILSNKIKQQENKYAMTFTQIKGKVMESAFRQFEDTVYAFFKLLDDYIHYNEYLNDVKLDSKLEEIEYLLLLEIEPNVIKLNSLLNKYDAYCSHCTYTPSMNFKTRIGTKGVGSAILVNTLISEIMKHKTEEFEKAINSNFTTLFAELDMVLGDPNLVTSLTTKLKPLEDKFVEVIKNEKEFLDTLESKIPKSSIEHLTDIINSARQTKRTVLDMTQQIEEVVVRSGKIY